MFKRIFLATIMAATALVSQAQEKELISSITTKDKNSVETTDVSTVKSAFYTVEAREYSDYIDSKTCARMQLADIEFALPKNYTATRELVDFDKNPKLSRTLGFLKDKSQLKSDNDEFVAFGPLVGFSYAAEHHDEVFGLPSSDLALENCILESKIILTSFLGKETDWKSNMNYYSKRNAKKYFNADVAFKYSISLNPEDYYKGEYNRLDVFVISKEDRNYVSYFCFSKNNSGVEVDKYLKDIESSVRFGE